MKINKPKLPLNSTPVRPRDVQSGYYSNQGITPTRQHENGMYMANLSPNKLNATKKPLAQKGYQTIQVQQQMPQIQLNQRRDSQANRPLAMLSKRAVNECMNHPNKQDGLLYCCHQCSVNLSNQGFNPQKIVNTAEINVAGANPILSSRRQSNTALIPNVPFKNTLQPKQHNVSNYNDFTLQVDPSLCQDSRYLQLQQFVGQCKQTLISFDQNIEGFQKVQEHYINQQQYVQEFYDAMIEYLKHIKTQHINLISTQAKKYIQIAQIQGSELIQQKESIQDILLDISENANDIIANVDEESFIQCMNQYKNNIERHNNRVQEQRSTFEQMSKIQPEQLEIKLQQFRTTVNDLFGVKQSQNRLPQKPNNMIPTANRNLGMGTMNSNGMNNINNFNRNNTGIMNGMNGMNSMNGMNQNSRGYPFNTGMTNNMMNNNGINNVNGVLGMMKNNNFNETTMPKANTNGAFRNLFGDDGTAQSPQFKDI